MFKSMKSLNWLESRIINFPKATETTKTTKIIKLVDFWGKKHTYVYYDKKPVNPFDGFGVIRSKVDEDGDYPFLTIDPVEFMTKVCTASNATKTAKSTWINEKTLNEAMKWTFNISEMRHKYSKYIDIILGK